MIVEQAHAKLNLMLNVTGKRPDGFHELVMVNIPLELADTLTFSPAQELILESSVDIEDNAVLKTAKLLKDTFHVRLGTHITLEKNIPIGAGLGGESADIAATLRGLNQLWKLGLTMDELEEIGLSLGADVPFCIYERPAVVMGRGEKLMFLDPLPIGPIHLIISDLMISTKTIFSAHRDKRGSGKAMRMIRRYLSGDGDYFLSHLFNDLEKTALQQYPLLQEVRKQTKKMYGQAHMTGSGSAYFVIDPGKNEVQNIKKSDKISIHILKTNAKS